MSDDTSLGADISVAMSGGTSTPEPSESASTGDTSAAPTGAATTEPAQVTSAISPAQTDTTTKQGPIPFDVHAKALDNARQKAIADWDRDYGWAKQVKQEEITQAINLARRASTDPIGYMREFLSELQSHPQHSQALRSEVARALGAGRGASKAMPEPNVHITDEHGNVVGRTFDAEGLAARDAYMFEQFMAKVDQKYAPVVKTHETLAAKQQQELDEAEGQKFAGNLIGELQAYPHFETHKEAIGAEVVKILSQYGNDPRVNDPAFLEAATLRAYHRIVTPTLNTSARQSVMADLSTKAQANTVSPNAPSTAAPKSYQDLSWGEAFQAELAARR